MSEAGIAGLGFAVVATADAALAAAAGIGYPVIVKPVLGVGKAATTITATAEELQAFFAGLETDLRTLAGGLTEHFDGRFILEELAVGDLYSVEVAADGHTFVPLVVAARKTGLDNPVLEMGCTVPAGLTPDDERGLGAYAVDVCRALGLDFGVFHLEVMSTVDGFRLIEANPRMAGGGLPDTINAATGRNIFGVLVDLFAGAPAPPGPFPIVGAASHSLLAAAVSTELRADLAPDWFAGFRDRVHSGWVRVGAGSEVKAMHGNFDTFGLIRTLEADIATAEARCTRVKADIGRALGIPLVGENVRKMFRL
ncbi:MAG: ATP-grasp domain-containing protein [Acidimicrobiales bacterium]